jgi:hypothetical protein
MEPTPHSRAVPGTFATFSKTRLVFPPSPVNSGGTGGLVNRSSTVSVVSRGTQSATGARGRNDERSYAGPHE